MRLIYAEEAERLFNEQVENGATDLFDAFEDALQDAQTVDVEPVAPGKWISVMDRLPPDQEEVLVCTLAQNGVRNIDKGYWAIDRFIHRGRSQVTHWMPLPELPEENE